LSLAGASSNERFAGDAGTACAATLSSFFVPSSFTASA